MSVGQMSLQTASPLTFANNSSDSTRLVSGYVSHLLLEGSITVTTAGASAITTQSLLQTLFREIRVTIAGADSRLKIRGDQLFQMNSLFSTSAPNVTISNAIGAGQVQLCSMVVSFPTPYSINPSDMLLNGSVAANSTVNLEIDFGDGTSLDSVNAPTITSGFIKVTQAIQLNPTSAAATPGVRIIDYQSATSAASSAIEFVLPTSGSVPIGARNGVNQVLPLNSYSQLYLVYNDSNVYTDLTTVIDTIQVSTPSTNLVNATVQQLQEQQNYAYGYNAANSVGFVNIPIINPIFGKLSGRLVTDIDTSQLTVTVNTTAGAAATGQILLARDVTNLPVPATAVNG